MSPDQEANLVRIQSAIKERLDSKYRKGDTEHGGELSHKSPLWLIDNAIDEAIDQITYLMTLRHTISPD